MENDPLGVVTSDERFYPSERGHASSEENFINGLLLSMYRAAQFEREHGEHSFEHGEHNFEHGEKHSEHEEQMFTAVRRKEGDYGGKS